MIENSQMDWRVDLDKVPKNMPDWMEQRLPSQNRRSVWQWS